jgi:hypothetical protein
LLTAIVLWLSTNCDLPATFEHPKIERVRQTEMVVRRHGSADRSAFTSPEVELQAGRQVVASYDDDHRTIYLAEDWTAAPRQSCRY